MEIHSLEVWIMIYENEVEGSDYLKGKKQGMRVGKKNELMKERKWSIKLYVKKHKS